MGKVTGFLEFERNDRDYRPVEERIRNYKEFVLPLPEKDIREQAARCMNCGVPYCHGTNTITNQPTGCPVNNQIPDWNDLVYQGNWEEASRNLHSTNNFPEFTGRICPAPCEASCTLNIDDNPVTIKSIECEIADRAIAVGLKPESYGPKTGKKVAVIGSGPAGMACAQQLARAGHDVHLYEKFAKAGGLMRYGIPDFKMEKGNIDQRALQMEAEGVTFHYGVHVGVDLPIEQLVKDYDAVALTGGAEKGTSYNKVRGDKVIAYAKDFLDQAVPLEQCSYTDVRAFAVTDGSLQVTLDGDKTSTLADPTAFVGYRGDLAFATLVVLGGSSDNAVAVTKEFFDRFDAPVSAVPN